MTTPDEYVPSEDEMISGLVQIPGEPAGIYRHVRVDEMKRGLARVRRDAAHLAAQEPTDAELDALYDAFIAHSEDERSEEYTRTEDGEPYHERICSECGEAVWIKGEHYWAATRANGARKRHHVARAALSAARAARRDEETR